MASSPQNQRVPRLISHVVSIAELSSHERLAILQTLTKRGSEFALAVMDRLLEDDPIAVVGDGLTVYGWASSHEWMGLQTLESYTLERLRCRGVSTLASTALLAAEAVDIRLPLAVFSPSVMRIAVRLGFHDIRQYCREGAEWTLVDSRQQKPPSC